MAPRKKIFREDIFEACAAVLRQGGEAALTVRRIAEAMGCSTQPIYSEFGSLEGLREAFLEWAEERYLRFTSGNYKAFAMAFLRFAQTEKELFKFLYLRRRNPEENLLDDVNYDITVELLSYNLEMTPQEAREMHQRMQYYCYALGVMIATDYREISQEELERELTEFYRIMLGHYKKVKGEAELQYWLDRSRNLMDRNLNG